MHISQSLVLSAKVAANVSVTLNSLVGKNPYKRAKYRHAWQQIATVMWYMRVAHVDSAADKRYHQRDQIRWVKSTL